MLHLQNSHNPRQPRIHTKMSSSPVTPDSNDLYFGIGIVFLAICPLLGATAYFVSSVPNFSPLINGLAGGILLGFALLHAFKDAVDGMPSEYPYAYLIAGSTLLFLYLVTSMVEPISKHFYRKSPLSKATINVNALWCALLVHGVFEGFSLGGLQSDASGTRWVILGVLFVHKIAEYSALTTSLLLAEVSLKSWPFWAILMSAEVPTLICFLVSWLVFYNQSTSVSKDPSISLEGLFAALATGTFLYLSLGHLIPEALCLETHKHCDIVVNDVLPTSVNNSEEAEHCKDDPTASYENEMLYLRPKVFLAIGLGWTLFALFALAPEAPSHSH